MKYTLGLVFSLALAGVSSAATGIFGGYLTVDGTKYKSDASYGGPETVFTSHDFGSLTAGSDTLVLSQAETLTFQNSGHSTFEFAFAYRVRPSGDAKSTNPADYAFVVMGDGVDLGGGDEKGEFTGGTIDLMSGLSNGTYAIDIVHKVGAFEGGSNFERLASSNNPNPGDTAWGSTDAFTATFTVVPEPSSAALLGLGGLALIMRRRK